MLLETNWRSSSICHTGVASENQHLSEVSDLSQWLCAYDCTRALPPPGTPSTTRHPIHRQAPLPPPGTPSTTRHPIHRQAPHPPQGTPSTTRHPFHHKAPLPPQGTPSTTTVCCSHLGSCMPPVIRIILRPSSVFCTPIHHHSSAWQAVSAPAEGAPAVSASAVSAPAGSACGEQSVHQQSVRPLGVVILPVR